MSDGSARDRVLVVDDEPDILEALKGVIEGVTEDITVTTADSAQAALEILKKDPFDLIITDQKMPGMTGLEFLQEVVKIQPHVPCIMVTAFPDTALAIQALNEGHVVNFLSKPLNGEEVIEVVASALEDRHAEIRRRQELAAELNARRQKESGPS